MFDPQFLASVRDLERPVQGTERMAELLYLLIRFTRARTVLEGGMGYTSPFIAKALRDNADAFAAERDAVREKSKRYVAEIDALPRGARATAAPAQTTNDPIHGPKASVLAERRMTFMFEQSPPLARPGYYLEPYAPMAYCIDDMSYGNSSAPLVRKRLAELGLDAFVTVRDGNFWTFDYDTLPKFDLMWVDLPVGVEQMFDLIQGNLWERLNPDGGLLLVHCMLSTEGGQLLVSELERTRAEQSPPQFEMLGLFEPHKVMQNNVLMIRKISGLRAAAVDAAFADPDENVFERDARRLAET